MVKVKDLSQCHPQIFLSRVIPCHCSGIGAGLGIRHQPPVQNRNILDAMGNFLANVAATCRSLGSRFNLSFAMHEDFRSPIFHDLHIHICSILCPPCVRSVEDGWE